MAQYMGGLESSLSEVMAGIASIPSTLISNVPLLLTYAGTTYIEDMVYQSPMIPQFMGSRYLVNGARKVVDAKLGKSVQ